MKICIIGGAGLIGSKLSNILARNGHDILILDSFLFNYTSERGASLANQLAYRFDTLLNARDDTIRIERCCLSEKSRIATLLDGFDPEVIVHLAAVPLVNIATRHVEEARASLSDGLLNVLEVVRAAGRLRRFVFASSSMVYGHFAYDQLDEDGPTAPLNIYGGLKLSGEVLAKAYLNPTPTEVTIVRPSAVYGPTDQHGRVVQKFCEAALEGRPLTLFEGNDNVMDFTFVEDIAQGFALAATHDAAAEQTFNMTFGQGRSLFELVDVIRRHVPGLRVEVKPSPDTDRPRRGGLSIDRAQRLLGYAPQYPLEKAIPLYLAHLAEMAVPALSVQAAE